VWAAVALIVRAASDGRAELLFIKRVEREGDSWSGQIALPGGREDEDDGSLQRTAIRETWEEIGLDLAANGETLGALDDVAPRTPVLPPIAVRPFVFTVPAHAGTVNGAEVSEVFWVPLDLLLDSSRWSEAEVETPAGRLRVQAVIYGEHVIWGMTLRIVAQLAGRLRAGPGS
jgi:8-oxo-dGTP pyrophosphatase MutT (NUDIX family)